MFAAAKQHSMERIRNASVNLDPFPYVYVEEVFPPDFYAEIQKRLLSDTYYRRLVDTGRVGKGYSPARLCLMPSDLTESSMDSDETATFWREIFETYNDIAFSQLWLDVFGKQISERVARGEIPEHLKGEALGIKHEMFLMRDKETYALPPHTDTPRKVVSVLFYLPPDDAFPHLGTTLYKPKNKALISSGEFALERPDVDIATTIPYRANALFAFPKTSVCFHGVEPVIEPHRRRDILLFDMKFTG